MKEERNFAEIHQLVDEEANILASFCANCTSLLNNEERSKRKCSYCGKSLVWTSKSKIFRRSK